MRLSAGSANAPTDPRCNRLIFVVFSIENHRKITIFLAGVKTPTRLALKRGGLLRILPELSNLYSDRPSISDLRDSLARSARFAYGRSEESGIPS
jgi:hypothetical protein